MYWFNFYNDYGRNNIEIVGFGDYDEQRILDEMEDAYNRSSVLKIRGHHI